MRMLKRLNEIVEDRDGATISFVIALFVVLLIGAVLIASIADNVAGAVDSAETSSLVDTILNLWPFMFALVPVIIIVKYLG